VFSIQFCARVHNQTLSIDFAQIKLPNEIFLGGLAAQHAI
jgi:hypothetical protein